MSLKSEIIALNISNEERTIDIPLYNFYNLIMRCRIDVIGLHLEILINDETDIKSALPIVGGETLQLTILDAHNNQIDKEFKVISYKGTSNASDNNNPLFLELVEKEAFELLYTREYKNYNDIKISDLLKELLPKDSDIEETKNEISILNPNWSKNKFIQKLTDRAINTKDNISFLFYQDYNNFYFKSLDTIIEEHSANVNDYVFDNYNPSYRYNIVDMKETSKPNYLSDQVYNTTNNEYVAYNPDAKDYKRVKLKEEDIDNKKLGKGKNQSKESLERKNKKITVVDYFNDDDIENTIKNDIVFKSYNKKMELLLNFDIEVVPGSLLNILIPAKHDSTELNKVLSGKWLVSKVAHQANLVTAHTKVEVIKNAFYDGEEKNKNVVE